ncbi:hypothetical protein QTA57_15575 [Fontisubflavum oceani]|uniref:hypothetical protein n=1 Tax=Fontisubflavum oceani TaxID=2978973 RepID=UPI0025B55B1C|nr:hypothetical protein [Fontisubflavum oceani]WJY21178.1 hypothetical protein QTA57_15575 [Fontisubflavum oceani]
MKILNPTALNRADLQRLGKYLAANGIKEITLTRKDGVQVMKRRATGWQVNNLEAAQ